MLLRKKRIEKWRNVANWLLSKIAVFGESIIPKTNTHDEIVQKHAIVHLMDTFIRWKQRPDIIGRSYDNAVQSDKG